METTRRPRLIGLIRLRRLLDLLLSIAGLRHFLFGGAYDAARDRAQSLGAMEPPPTPIRGGSAEGSAGTSSRHDAVLERAQSLVATEPPQTPRRGGNAEARASAMTPGHSTRLAAHTPVSHSLARSASHSALLAKSVYFNIAQLHAFGPNRVITSRYTPITFLPVSLASLLNPFNRIANFYFLCVGAMQTIPAITITEGRAGTFMPLAFVLLVDLLMRGVEDYARHRADAETNSQPVDVLHYIFLI